jgi:BirA family transcriptional regulator, biotin operon repressor / biotin---[acetyl-CoA-carboxylase] ligase
VGINVAMADDQAYAIEQPWVDLRSILEQQGLPRISRNLLVATLIDELVQLLHGYEETGFAGYCAEWQSFNAHVGQVVELRNGNLNCSGVCVGVSEVGALILETARGREVFHGGEISLRRTHDS